jgi:hypothetical protein
VNTRPQETGVHLTLETATLIRAAFLPHNPNKMRNADPSVVEAAREFIRLVEEAQAEARARA